MVRTVEIPSRVFHFVLLLLVGAAILRSAIATRLDSFTYDEPYHIAAGVSYIRARDFRLNPEHPPLVKLWVGTLMSVTGFRLSALRPFHDKFDERHFAHEDVFLHNDPESVQRRSRLAMWALNGLLLIALGMVVRRVFNSAVALGTIFFLGIDPTVAAHLPVVMTDLPVALLATMAVALTSQVLQAWQWEDVILCSLALGLTMGAKHSGLVIWLFVGLVGLAVGVLQNAHSRVEAIERRLLKVSIVLVSAIAVLWSLYSFRFHESYDNSDAFNRPLPEKIADVESPAYNFALNQMVHLRVMPRSYIWGLADTVHAGVEGRGFSQFAFGQAYYKKAPRFFFPGVIAVKLPLGLSVLALAGVWLLIRRRLPHEWNLPLVVVFAALIWFLGLLSSGATYAGVRHALPALALLSIFGGVMAYAGFSSTSRVLRAFVVFSFLAACLSAVPVVRPWEYYNDLVGGTSKAYQYFDDEGLDLGLRVKELSDYYHHVLRPVGEIPYCVYLVSDQELEFRGVDWVGHDPSRDQPRMLSPVFSGTILEDATFLGRGLWWDDAELRAATPVARFGNLFVFRGTFHLPGKASLALYVAGLKNLYAAKPNLQGAELMFRQSAELDANAFFVNIELGNVRLRLGSRDQALNAYAAALQHAPNDLKLRRSIQHQIQLVSTVSSLDQAPTLHDPSLE